MHKWVLEWLGIVVLLSTQALALEVNYADGEDKTSDISVGTATELKFDGATATQSGDISGTDALTITGGSGTLHLTGDNTTFTGMVTHSSGTLVFEDDENLFGMLSKYNFQGDAIVSENQDVKDAIDVYRTTPTGENWQLVLDAIDIARSAGVLPTFAIAEDSTIVIAGSAANQRLAIGEDMAGSFHLESGASLTFKDTVNNSSGSNAAGGAIQIGSGSLLTLTANDDTTRYIFSNNSVTTTSYWAEGGAIRNAGYMTLNHVDFNKNFARSTSSSATGGAIRNSGRMILTDANFTDNYVSAWTAAGGVIYNEGTVILTNANFTGNRALANSASAYSYGGAIYNGGTIIMTDVNFINNYADASLTNARGGAIYNASSGIPFMTLNVTAGQESVFTGNVTVSSDGTSANSVYFASSGSLTVDTADGAVLDMRDPMQGGNVPNGSTRSITKSGTGIWKLGGKSAFTSAGGKNIFTVNDGTLYLYRAGEVDNANLTYTPGAKVEAGSINLAGANSSFTLASGATLSIGGGAWDMLATSAPNTIAASMITINDNATLSFDLAHHDAINTNEMLTLTGAVILSSVNDMTIDISSLNADAGTYTLVKKTNTSSFDGINYNVTLRGEEITNPRLNLSVTATTDEIKITQSGGLDNTVLTWTGATNDKWNASAENWTDIPGGTPVVEQFMQGDIVNFANTSGDHSVEVNAGGVQAAGMYVSGGATYEFSGGEIVLDATSGTTFTNPPDTAATGKLVLGANAEMSGGNAVYSQADFTGMVDLTSTDENSFKGGVDLYGGKLRISDENQLGTTLTYVSYLADLFSSPTLEEVKDSIANYKATPNPENESLMLAAIAVAQDEGYIPSIDIAENSAVTFDGNGGDSKRLTISNGMAGSFHLENSASMNFTDSVNQKIGANAEGGSIVVGNNSLLTFTAADDTAGYIFSNNSATATNGFAEGGGIRNAGHLIINNGEFNSNFVTASASSARGGAIYNTTGTAILTNVNFTYNNATSTNHALGGAIYNNAAMVLTNANFTNNSVSGTAVAYGGAIHNSNVLTLTNANFRNNHAAGEGGAIYNDNGAIININVTEGQLSTFTGNVVVKDGNASANSIHCFSFTGTEYGSLTINTANEALLDMRDPMTGFAGAFKTFSITKSGTGTWNLGGENTFTSVGGRTSFAVNEGTLYLYRAGEADNANPTYTPGAKVATGNISLAGAGSAFTLADDATLSVGGVGHAIVVSDGAIGLAADSILAFDMTDATTSTTNLALTAANFTGAAIGSGDIEVTNFTTEAGSAAVGDAYTLVDTATAGKTANTGVLYVDGVRHYTGRSSKEYGLATDADAKQLQIKFIDATQNADLTWTGSQNENWNETDGNWKGMIDGVNVNKFKDGDSVTFDSTATRKTVTVDAAGVTVNKMTVSDSDYTFNLTAGQTAAITATGTDGKVDLGNATLNIAGYTPDAATDHFTDPTNVMTLISTDNGVTNFNSEIKVSGQTNSDSFLTASAYLDDGGKNVKVATGLRWYSTDPTRKAHGNFEITGDNTFTLGAVLKDNSASINKATGWDGNSLTKTGTGELILTAANIYTGDTAVESGTLRLANANAVALSDVSVKSGSILAVDQSSNVNSLSLNGSTLAIIAGDIVTATGTITLAGTNTIDLAMDHLMPGTYDILTGASVAGFNAGNFNTLINGNGLSGRAVADYLIDSLHTTVTLDLSFMNLDLIWQGGSGNWSDAKWDGVDDNLFYDGDRVTFAHGTGEVTVNVGGVEVANMTVSGGKYTFKGGSISSSGSGKLTVADASATFANDIDFAGGIDVLAGGELYGTGSAKMVGSVSVASGGTFGAESDTTPTVDSLTMASGSTFAITDSLTSVIGTANISSGVNFTFGSDLYAGNAYTVLTSSGITGWTGPEEYSSGFLRYIVETVNGTDLRVLVETYRRLIDLGLTPNQAAALSGLESWSGGNNQLYNAILALDNDDDARRALSALTGQIHANLPATLIRQNRDFWQLLDGPVLFLRGESENTVVNDSRAYASLHPCSRLSRQPLLWFSAGGLNSRSRNHYDSARDRMNGKELMIGDETVLGGWNLGLAFRYADTRLKVNERASTANFDNYQLGLYAVRETCLGDGELRFTLGAVGGYHDIATNRQVAYGDINQRLKADYHAWSLSGITEVAYRLKETQNLALEPYLVLGWDSLWNGAFNESGGSAALLGNAGHQGNFSATAGLRSLYQLSGRISVNAKAGWRHSFGSVRPQSNLAFMDSPTRDLFAINGTRLVRDEFVGGVGARMDLSKNVFIRADYNIEAGSSGFAHRGTMSAGVGF